MKAIGQILGELAIVHRKQDLRSMRREKELYAYWRNSKLLAIEHARKCKKLGLTKLQLRWQKQAAKYDKWAKESKAHIHKLGESIYK